MQRALVLVLALAVVVVAATLVLTNSPAEAKKPFDNGDLDGSYAWVNTEISLRDGVVTYCNAFGTIEFFGDGTASNDSTNRCTYAGNTVDPVPFDIHYRSFDYSMEPDGNFLLWEVGGSGSTHCRLVDKGAMIICDGTASQPDILSMSAVAVRQ
jgi:hypothetical protein